MYVLYIHVVHVRIIYTDTYTDVCDTISVLCMCSGSVVGIKDLRASMVSMKRKNRSKKPSVQMDKVADVGGRLSEPLCLWYFLYTHVWMDGWFFTGSLLSPFLWDDSPTPYPLGNLHIRP